MEVSVNFLSILTLFHKYLSLKYMHRNIEDPPANYYAVPHRYPHVLTKASHTHTHLPALSHLDSSDNIKDFLTSTKNDE